jgi:His-Xaa-Ser system radical SAM maturase HxsC
MLNFNGEAVAAFPPIIGEICAERVPFYKRHDKILVSNDIDMGCLGYAAIITTQKPYKSSILPHIVGGISETDLAEIKSGDIVSLEDTGSINILWEEASDQNVLLLTEACNCRCKMCPQPPHPHVDQHYMTANRILDLLKRKMVKSFCLTGGEPTIVEDNFINVLSRCHMEHPEACVYILTNGKIFADDDFTQRTALIASIKDLFCVSLHSDIDAIHDDLVGSNGSYVKTQTGIYNLARRNIAIEIRHVITQSNYRRLLEFAGHIYRYFPFCRHIAFMTLELYGLAKDNYDEIYIDPIMYKDELRKAVLALSRRGMNVSIYNTPLCLCHNEVMSFARKSISSWKNNFNQICAPCAQQENCCGFFSTSFKAVSNSLKPFLAKEV